MSGFVWEDALFREYFPKLVKIAMHYVHDMVLAEDMAQEAFLVFLDKGKAGALDDCGNIGAWLKTVVVNRCRSEMQRMRYHVEEPLLDEVISTHGPDQLPFAEQLPRGLSDAERQTLCCFYEYRMSHRAMAAFYGIPHYHISDMDLEKVTWVDGDIQGVITGSVSREELQQVVASIYAEQ